MDNREQRRLEEEKDRKLRKIDKELEQLDVYFTRAKRSSDQIMERAHHYYIGEGRDFMKILDKSHQNLIEFERSLGHRRQSFETEKKKIKTEFEKKGRTGR